MATSRSLDREPEPGAGADHNFFVERVELRGNAGEDSGGHVRAIRGAMQLLIRGLADARARRMRVGDQLVQSLRGERCRRIECKLVDGAFDVNELRLESGEWFAKEAQSFEQPYDIRADPGWRTEVHDIHGNAAADPIEPPDPLLDH